MGATTSTPGLLLAGPAAVRHDPAAGVDSVIAVDTDLCLEGVSPNTVLVPWEGRVQAACAGTAPLFLMTGTERGWRPYTQTSFTGDQVLFMTLPGPPLNGDSGERACVTAWAVELAERHRSCGPRAVNHQRWWLNALPGQELEHKFTLPGQPDVWTLSCGVLDAVRAGALPGWVLEHGNNGGFEQWEFDNHLYEIAAPRADRGYIAFIPAVDGSWIIRRKRYQKDAALRDEELIEHVNLHADPDLAQVVRERFGVQPGWRGIYRRYRTNVLLESLGTGHVFSIMADRCVDRSGRADDLHQVEVEYVRSRTLRPPDTEPLFTQFAHLVAWTRGFLAQRGLTAAEDHLSKLSWLRSSPRRA